MRSYFGNRAVRDTLEGLIRQDRIPQTILLDGPDGIGKATLVRRFAAGLLGGEDRIEQDDLSLSGNQAIIADREKWPSEKRNDDPLLFASHPDFVTFPPDGPLRQITIQQMRLLKDRAKLRPLKGRYRVFLIDHIDRANEQAANSLLKTLEEPPEHMLLFMTAENPYDLLPTIRSRAVPFHLAPLAPEELQAFLAAHGAKDVERRAALAAGSPGMALSLDLDQYDKRRSAMLALLAAASGAAPFGSWVKAGETIGSSRSEKLEPLLKVLYGLLEDLLVIVESGGEIRNFDVRPEMEKLARVVTFDWIARAVARTDELIGLVRRNIQKGIALDALILELRPS